jgi:5-(carboxyamino)imidazole ribonucleotide synthase
MLALAGIPLGERFVFWGEGSDEARRASPAADVGTLFAGAYADPAAIAAFAERVDVVTYEFENVALAQAEALAARVPVYPPPRALAVSQDRFEEKTFFTRLGIPTPSFNPVDTRLELDRAAKAIGLPAVLKWRRFGYDGKGQAVLWSESDLNEAWNRLGSAPCILESFVHFEREVSIIAVRGRTGELHTYPIFENGHEGGILRTSHAPARGTTGALETRAAEYARAVAEALGYVGVLTLELFVTKDGLVANEMAPRVHNSGHLTIEGAVTSQFENHVRAVLGLPLGSTALTGYARMVNLLGRVPPIAPLLAVGARVHLYGKEPAPGRKVGHVTVCAANEDTADARTAEVLRLIA